MDYEFSLMLIDVLRDWLWDLVRRIVYFGIFILLIFKGILIFNYD